MLRRVFVKSSTLASLGIGLAACSTKPPVASNQISHYLSLSFDDGFKKSFHKAAEIHEEYGLKGCFNVIATAHLASFKQVGDYILPELMGSFHDWNRLASRGHEVMPHTWEHLKLTEVPIDLAKKNIAKCLDYFEKHLEGYKPDNAVYNFAYSASTPELEEFAMQRVKAARTGGGLVLKDTPLNKIPTTPGKVKLGCWASGPANCDDYLESEVNKFLVGPSGWLIINLHGLDDEGWGPVSTKCYVNLLKRLIDIKFLKIMPVGEILKTSA